MKNRGQPYSLGRRQNVDGSFVFTARFRKPGGSFGTAKSTGVLDKGKDRDRDRAVAWCEQYLAGGQVTTGANMTLATFGEGFFDWSADYARDRILRGKRYSQEQAYNHSLNFKKWISGDAIGKMRLETINDQAVGDWQLRLARCGLAPKTIHQQTMALRILLKAAYRAGHLRQPIQYEPISGSVKNRRGMLSLDEATKVFSLPWDDPRYLVGNLLAIVTGLRAGEIVGLRFSMVLDADVLIVGTWRPRTAMVSDTTKGGEPRKVPVPASVMLLVRALMDSNPWLGRVADPFVFWSNSGPGRALAQRELTEALHAKLDKVIGKGVWRARRIGMHSWRVFTNTAYLEGAVPSAMIEKTIGHTSVAMTALYYRPQAMAPVRAVQDEIAASLKLPATGLPVKPGRKSRARPAG